MNLNEAQKQAALHIDGPLIIIAGAGTGKTTAITQRILNLVNSSGVSPRDVLALTFTEKAAHEMLERVDVGMPLGYEEMAIKTFHSFSESVLREAGMEIGIDPGFQILDQVKQWFFFRRNLFSFDLDYYRPLGNPNRFIYAILSHFGKLKDELIPPEKYMDYAQTVEGEDGIKMREIANVYSQYQKLLIEKNFLDFADLSYFAVELFSKRESVLREYQKRFKYILVDEFQDTNYAQYQLVKLLGMGHKNVAVVGDDDQSIYKWRGASLSNILKFQSDFDGADQIVLTENYRSNASILDCSYQLVQNNNPDRLEHTNKLDKRLRANTDKGGAVEVRGFNHYSAEVGFVIEKIKELKLQGAEWGDFAILVRANQLALPFIDELKHSGIPYKVRDPKGLMKLDVVKDLISVVKFLANPYDDVALTRILKMHVFEIPMQTILKLLNRPKKDHLVYKIREDLDGDDVSLPGLEDPLKKVLDLFDYLVEFSKNNPVGLVINEFLEKSGYLEYLVQNDAFSDLENINALARHVASFERDSETSSAIDFVSYLNLLEESNSPIRAEENVDSDAVQILTVHSSKGLEFDNVFVVNCVKHRFPAIRRRDQFEIPEELTNEFYPEGDYHIQEERRLMYVAMTRARARLFLTWSQKYEGNKKWKISPFIEEVKGQVKTFDPSEDEDVFEIRKPEKVSVEDLKLPPFRSRRLSYSQVDTFETCPLKYNFRYVMKVPSKQSHAANFGTSIHETLNIFYQRLKNGEQILFDDMKKIYEANWLSYGYSSKAHENARKKHGLELLENFYNVNNDPWVIPAFLERPFTLKIGEMSFSGRIDRIDRLSDGTYEVIDYKTGSSKRQINLDKDLQLSMYALACRDVYNINVSKLSLYFIEDNSKKTTERNVEQLEEFKDRVVEIVESMKSSNFTPNPGFHCQFCDYQLLCPAV